MPKPRTYTLTDDGQRRWCAERQIRPGLTVGVSAETKSEALRRLRKMVEATTTPNKGETE